MKYYFKKIIWEGPNQSSISELIENESKKPNVSCVIYSYIVFYKNSKFWDCRFENSENTRLKRPAT
jgi:hypothetical protein